eukprot:Gb_02504 [translate_table: standard]
MPTAGQASSKEDEALGLNLYKEVDGTPRAEKAPGSKKQKTVQEATSKLHKSAQRLEWLVIPVEKRGLSTSGNLAESHFNTSFNDLKSPLGLEDLLGGNNSREEWHPKNLTWHLSSSGNGSSKFGKRLAVCRGFSIIFITPNGGHSLPNEIYAKLASSSLDIYFIELLKVRPRL